GVGYVPQGRRLWRSLSVDEHLQLAGGMRSGAWTVERIYDTFPRLAERRDHGGGQLSGGEQQMLAISRALLTNPHLLIMDEPTEGLAPVIVAQVEEMLLRLGEDGDMSVLVIEQNIGVATAVSRNVAIMVNGRINRIIDSARLAADRELQQRLLGVGLHAELEPDIEISATGPDRPGAGAHAAGELQMLVDAERAPQTASLRHVADAEPGDLGGWPPCDVRAA
ncbi:ABC transporter ATP-binding protein, partial [Bradyrhizobium ottawaense]|uniref:ABC transporter ATP-binding protein n=1 Tax=Bradyrhizobium ottawaense TaxID=931866 RepID=UPI0030C6A2C6